MGQFLTGVVFDGLLRRAPAALAAMKPPPGSQPPLLLLGEEALGVPWEAALGAGGGGGGAPPPGGRLPSLAPAALRALAARVAAAGGEAAAAFAAGAEEAEAAEGGGLPPATAAAAGAGARALWSWLSRVGASASAPPPSPPLLAWVVDPLGDLPSTARALSPVLAALAPRRGGGGGGALFAHEGAPPPAPAPLLRALSAPRSSYLYAGHGAGESWLPRALVERAPLGVACEALLMGCSSARLARPAGGGGGAHAHGSAAPEGAVAAFLTAGAPRVAGNLWDVTDRDCDRFTAALLEAAVARGGRASEGVAAARAACKLPHLVGAAAVVYGVPRG